MFVCYKFPLAKIYRLKLCESFRNRYSNVILQVCFVQISTKIQQNSYKTKNSKDNQKTRRKIIKLQPQNIIYSSQVKLNKTTYLSFKHIICCFMVESNNVTENLVFAVNSLITLYQIRHFYLLAKWRPRCARRHARPHWHQRFRQKWDFCYNSYSVIQIPLRCGKVCKPKISLNLNQVDVQAFRGSSIELFY